MRIAIRKASKNKKTRWYYIRLSDKFEDFDFDEMALQVYPYYSLKERLARVFYDIYEAYKKEYEIKSEDNMKIYNGKSSEIQMEVWENGKHILLAKGEKWLCPCNMGYECKME